MLAQRVADRAAAARGTYIAVAAVRFDAFDVGAEIDRLIAAYEPDPRHASWLRDWSLQERALPVVFDLGGVYGMRRDGSIVSAGWDAPSTRVETAAMIHFACVIGAAQRNPTLAALLPRSPAQAPDCDTCPHSLRARTRWMSILLVSRVATGAHARVVPASSRLDGEGPPSKSPTDVTPWWCRLFRRRD